MEIKVLVILISQFTAWLWVCVYAYILIKMLNSKDQIQICRKSKIEIKAHPKPAGFVAW